MCKERVGFEGMCICTVILVNVQEEEGEGAFTNMDLLQ